MARVVQRRKTPPYALIATLVVLVGVAAFLVDRIIELDRARTEITQLQDDQGQYLNDDQRKLPDVAQMLAIYDQTRQDATARGGVKALTLYGQQAKAREDLVSLIVGKSTSAEDAIKQADDLRTELRTGLGLIDLVRSRLEANKILEGEKKLLADENNTLSAAIRQAEEARKRLQGEQEQLMADRRKQIAALQAQFGQYTEERNKQMATAVTDHKQAIQRKEVQLKQKDDEINAAKNKIRERTKQVDQLTAQNQRRQRRVEAAMRPDGVVMKIEEGGKILYINLGENDGVEVGFTFSVFPQTGIPKASEKPEEKQKGSLIVVGVAKDVARCQVVKVMDPQDPILDNDPIINVAFDSIRRWKFMVQGNFDLHGTGTPNETGAAEVKLLLRRLGAEVVSELDYDVDFLIEGAEAVTPRQPDEEAPPQAWEIWRQILEKRKRFKETRAKAVQMGIPIMNDNALLSLTGYAPIKALRDIPR